MTLAECCFGPKEIGACVYLDEEGPLELALFQEAPSRILFSTGNPKAVQQIAKEYRVLCNQIGRTKAGRLEISNGEARFFNATTQSPGVSLAVTGSIRSVRRRIGAVPCATQPISRYGRQLAMRFGLAKMGRAARPVCDR